VGSIHVQCRFRCHVPVRVTQTWLAKHWQRDCCVADGSFSLQVADRATAEAVALAATAAAAAAAGAAIEARAAGAERPSSSGDGGGAGGVGADAPTKTKAGAPAGAGASSPRKRNKNEKEDNEASASPAEGATPGTRKKGPRPAEIVAAAEANKKKQKNKKNKKPKEEEAAAEDGHAEEPAEQAEQQAKNTKKPPQNKRQSAEQQKQKQKQSVGPADGDDEAVPTLRHASTLEIAAQVREAFDEVVLAAGTLKILTWNVNGLRAFLKKRAVWEVYLRKEDPDIICLNETKISDSDVPSLGDVFSGYPHVHWHCCSAKKGYSGTAIFSKQAPTSVVRGFHPAAKVPQDDEGRVLTARFSCAGVGGAQSTPATISATDSATNTPTGTAGSTTGSTSFALVAAYVPNSGQQLERLGFRTKTWDARMQAHLAALAAERPSDAVILCGDLNVAHRDVDLTDPKPKRNKVGGTGGGTRARVVVCVPQDRASLRPTLSSSGLCWRGRCECVLANAGAVD
jgi:exodeoxyribonuclease III